jgi:DNA-binding NarL/FixJ family response regulator
MRILLAEDQPKVRYALRVLLERQPGLEIVGEVVDAENLVSQVLRSLPDVVLLSWELPGKIEATLLSELHQARPALAVIALSGQPEARRSALSAGADDFVSKGDPPDHLLAAIAGYQREHL